MLIGKSERLTIYMSADAIRQYFDWTDLASLRTIYGRDTVDGQRQ